MEKGNREYTSVPPAYCPFCSGEEFPVTGIFDDSQLCGECGMRFIVLEVKECQEVIN